MWVVGTDGFHRLFPVPDLDPEGRKISFSLSHQLNFKHFQNSLAQEIDLGRFVSRTNSNVLVNLEFFEELDILEEPFVG